MLYHGMLAGWLAIRGGPPQFLGFTSRPCSGQAGQLRHSPGTVGREGKMAAPEGEATRQIFVSAYIACPGFSGAIAS